MSLFSLQVERLEDKWSLFFQKFRIFYNVVTINAQTLSRSIKKFTLGVKMLDRKKWPKDGFVVFVREIWM